MAGCIGDLTRHKCHIYLVSIKIYAQVPYIYAQVPYMGRIFVHKYTYMCMGHKHHIYPCYALHSMSFALVCLGVGLHLDLLQHVPKMVCTCLQMQLTFKSGQGISTRNWADKRLEFIVHEPALNTKYINKYKALVHRCQMNMH